MHSATDGFDPEDIRINQEVPVGVPGAFADFKVTLPSVAPYFAEIKYGYQSERIIKNIAQKYGADAPGTRDAEKLILILNVHDRPDWPKFEGELQSRIRRGLQLEVWTESELSSQIQKYLNLEIRSVTVDDLVSLRHALDHTQAAYAFGEASPEGVLRSALLWHLSFWRLRRLCSMGHSESPLRNRHNRPSLGKGRKNLYVAGMNWSRGDLHESIIRPEFFALKLTLG